MNEFSPSARRTEAGGRRQEAWLAPLRITCPVFAGGSLTFDTDSPKEPCWAARGVGFDPEQRYVIAVSDRSPRPGNGKELGKC
ncbi:hypothetical protein AOLI_G00315380 [Acnodon oligacanthus]